MPALRRSSRLPTGGDISREAVPSVSGQAETGGIDMGEMRRAIEREEQDRRKQDRYASTLVIAAA